jgi:hypothetical protein
MYFGFVADLVFWDMPYGMGLARCDVLLSDLELETFFKNLAVINRSQAHCLVLGCIWSDMGRIRAAMQANGYGDQHPLVNVKLMQNTSGMEFIKAVEFMVAGYKGGVRNCHLTFPDVNPVFRHNVLFGHQVGPKRKYPGEDEEVNTTQKNPNIASALGRIMCTPGANALVLGAGSGSEVLGLARVGVNVVGIERDAKQFRALTERISTEAALPEAAQKQLAEDDRQINVFKQLAAKFTKLNSDVSSHFTEMQLDSSPPSEGDSQSREQPSSTAAEETACPACGLGVQAHLSSGCSKPQCPVKIMHTTCTESCNSCRKAFCSKDCAGNHGCSE